MTNFPYKISAGHRQYGFEGMLRSFSNVVFSWSQTKASALRLLMRNKVNGLTQGRGE